MKVSKFISYILLGVCIFLCFYVSFQIVVAIKRDLPVSLFSYSVSYVPTNSMEDEIMPGDYVLFKKTEFGQVDVNDVIVYKSKSGNMKGNYIIHRVIEEHNGYFITQGDNNPLPDEEHITADMIVGEYVKVVSFIGFIVDHKTLIVVILFILVIVSLLSQYATNYLKKKQKENEEEQLIKKEQLLEQLKQEILEEELEKIRNSKK